MPTIEEMIQNSKQKLGAVGGIPNTIVTGTQNSYGANIPTVEGLKQNLTSSVQRQPSGPGVVGFYGLPTPQRIGRPAEPASPPPPDLMDQIQNPEKYDNETGKLLPTKSVAAIGANPSLSTPTTKPNNTFNPAVDAVSRPEGDPNFFKGGTTFQPSTGLGASPSDTKWTDKDLAEWKARGIATGNHGVLEGREGLDLTAADRAFIAGRNSNGSNPNDALFTDVAKKLVDVAGSGPSIGRATNVAALKGVLNELGPLTSYGNFGVAGMHDETTQRGQDITADTAAGLQGVYRDKNAMDALYQSGLLKQGEEKIGIEKLKIDTKTPEGFLKRAIEASPKIKVTDPVTGAETESHDIAKGVELLTQAGFETPKGFNVPGQNKAPTFDEFLATAAKNKSKMTKEQLTQYYNEKYAKRGAYYAGGK